MFLNLSKVYHVGFLNVNDLEARPVVDFSLEESGLSVSQCPDEWTKIAKLGVSDRYILKKENPNFFMAHEDGNEKALEWCLENGYLKRAKKYRAYNTDEDGEEYYMELDKRSEAERESEDVRSVNGYVFDEKGIQYWKSHFSSKVRNDFAEAFSVVFYAEHCGFDGVWWNDILDVNSHSAPRGVIFQSKLSEWKITKV